MECHIHSHVIPKGTPTRIKNQLRKAYANYDDVTFDSQPYKQISTFKMREIESKKIKAYVELTQKVPSGNVDHARRGYGVLADDFSGVHDLIKDLKMKNNLHISNDIH